MIITYPINQLHDLVRNRYKHMTWLYLSRFMVTFDWLFSSQTHTVPDKCVVRTLGVLASASILYGTYIWSDIHFLNKSLLDTKPVIVSERDKFIAKHKKLFIKTYDATNPKAFNQNIDNIFYDIEKYDKEMSDRDNLLEPLWKRRTIMEHTPLGNVLMFYDAYKHAFSYYADSSNIPYDILNAVAMKYVLVYRCRDFFIDSSIFILNNDDVSVPIFSPFQRIHEIDKKTKKVTISNKKIDTKSGPFLQVKSKIGKKVDVNANINKKTDNTPTIFKNKFVYNGKMRVFSILQSVPTVVKNTTKNPYELWGF